MASKAKTANGKGGGSGRGSASGAWDASHSAAGSLNPWLLVAIISIPTFMEVLDTSIANVSLEYIAGGLAITNDQATWVLTSYLVANAVVIPLSGWLSDAIGRKRYFMISIALFTTSSFLCGIAPNLTFLVIARVFQGIGGGGLAPVEQSMLADTFPPEKRGIAFAAFAIVVVVGPVLGPSLGGYITEYSSWHWVFLINVPVGILALFLVATFVDEPEAVVKDREKKLKGGLSIDWLGVALVFLGLGFLEIVADRGERQDWFSSPLIVVSAIISAVSLIALVIWETNTDDPIINLKLLKSGNFSMTLVVMMITGLILFGSTQLIPQMLQQVLGYSALDAGLALTLGGIGTLIAVPIAGQLTGKIDVRVILITALLVQAAALWNLSHFDAGISFRDAAIGRLYQSIALPFLFVPINAVAYIGLPRSATGQASALLNVARNLGGTLGISSAQTLLAHQQQIHQSRLVEGLSPLNPNYNEWVGQARDVGASAGGDPQMTAMGILYSTVQKQASMEAFISVFHMLMWLVLIVTPLVLLMRSATGKQAGGGGGGH